MPLKLNQTDALKDAPRPLERSPCANVEPLRQWNCPNEGKLACANCQIVGYCSKECQKKHWSMHKTDCKDRIRSENWTPAWVLEDRSPTFMSNNHPDENWLKNLQKNEPIALGMHLWGNIPAMDLLKLSANENLLDKDVSLACVASGDIRNIVRTINELPSDFSGKISILLNDREPVVVIRNIILLLILGTVPDHTVAADLALHFWYSALIPSQYASLLSEIMAKFIETLKNVDEDHVSMLKPLGQNSTLSGKVNNSVVAKLVTMWSAQYDIMDVGKEVERVRFAPSRQDRHDRAYCRLEPSHRLSRLEFRRFGLVLPFGARNDYFNHPNRFLFSQEGKWLQDDLANPLESWDIPAIIEAGKAHGARRADIYGCLYFFLSGQLREFVERLSRFRIEIRLFCEDASNLSSVIRQGDLSPYGIPSSTKFDRIEVSNILDANYVGIPGVLEAWGPFLKLNKYATLIGSFMNWPTLQNGANAQTVGKHTSSLLTKRLLEKDSTLRPQTSTIEEIKRAEGRIIGHLNCLTALYDNSKSFKEYLAKYGLHEALLKGKLKLKERHTVVPHRICAPLGASSDTLPSFPDKESWYLNACVGAWLWSERFVEISRT